MVLVCRNKTTIEHPPINGLIIGRVPTSVDSEDMKFQWIVWVIDDVLANSVFRLCDSLHEIAFQMVVVT
jgi:hypothetical protein